MGSLDKKSWGKKLGIAALIIGLIVDLFDVDKIFGINSIFVSLFIIVLRILVFRIAIWIILLVVGLLGVGLFFLKRRKNSVDYSDLEECLALYDWYRQIMEILREPKTFEEIGRQYHGRKLNRWLRNLEERGGVTHKNGRWTITLKGREILDKYV